MKKIIKNKFVKPTIFSSLIMLPIIAATSTIVVSQQNQNTSVINNQVTHTTKVIDPSVKKEFTIADYLITPPIMTNGIIDATFINDLITYKEKTDPTGSWNGVLGGADFVDATSVADNAFLGKIEVTSVILPMEVLSIGANAFKNATNLVTIEAPGARTIGANACSGANKITTITLTSAASIGKNAFQGTTSIIAGGIKLLYSSETVNYAQATTWGTTRDKLSFGDTIPGIPPVVNNQITSAFVTSLIDYKDKTSEVWEGALVATDFFGATVITIEAFLGNTTITSVILPNSVKTIGGSAFKNATNLRTIEALGVTNIFPSAFSGATSIQSKGLKITASLEFRNTFTIWGFNNTQTDLDKIEWIGLLVPKLENKTITKTIIEQIITYDNYTKIDKFNGTVDAQIIGSPLVSAEEIANNAFSITDGSTINQVKILILSNTIKTIGASAFSNSSLLEISLPIGAYPDPETGTFGLNQTQFNNLNWTNTASLINGGTGIYDANADRKLFIAKLINQGLSTSTIISENNLKGYTSIVANAFGNNVTEIFLPNNFNTSTNVDAFKLATNLTKITLPSGSTISISIDEIIKKYSIPKSVTVEFLPIISQAVFSKDLINSMIILSASLGGVTLIFIILVSSVIYNNRRKIIKFNNINIELTKEKETPQKETPQKDLENN